MKKYVRICYYTDKADVVLAFLSSLLLIYIGLCYTEQLKECFYQPYISSEYLAAGVLAVNYVMLIGANPLRIFLAVLLLPARLFVVLIKPFFLILSILSSAAAAGAGAEANRAFKNNNKKLGGQKLREMGQQGAIAVASGAVAASTSGIVESRIRSLNGAYIRKASKSSVLPDAQRLSEESGSEYGGEDVQLLKNTKHKSPLLAGWLSIMLPGAGQMYCGRIGRGLMYPFLFLVSIVVMAETDASVGVCLLVLIALPVLSCLDARRLARQYKN